MRLFAVIGNPISHSKSPKMHNFAIKQLELDAFYGRIKLEQGKDLISILKNRFLDGINITVPYKEDAFEVADILGEREKKIGAINTLVNKNGKYYGYNTDIDGIIASIQNFPKIKNGLILGAGGTARAASIAFLEQNIKPTILNRTTQILDFFKNLGIDSYSYDDFRVSDFDFIFNTTSAGLSDDSYPLEVDILEQLFSYSPSVMDAIYGKETPFLNLAKKFDLNLKDGEDMLLWQGAYAFTHFFGESYKASNIYPLLKKGVTL